MVLPFAQYSYHHRPFQGEADTNNCTSSVPSRSLFPGLLGSVAKFSCSACFVPTTFLSISQLAHIPDLLGSTSFATFSAQLRTLLLTKWLEASQGTLLVLSALVTVVHTLTTGLSEMQLLQEYSILFTLWTVWYWVLLLTLKQDYEHGHHTSIKLSTRLTTHSINARQRGHKGHM